MDAWTLLREVSEAYRSLKSLALEAALIDESGDENTNQRSERRVRFFYAAPNRIRYEPCGKRGILQVADGEQLHTLQTSFPSRPAGIARQRYTSVPIAETVPPLPHRFNPEWPASAEAYLFQGIDERVVSAEILCQEDGCYVVSVAYEPPPRPGLMVSGSPVLVWVDERNHMVMRRQGKSGHRFPTEEEVIWSRHTVVVRQMRVNEPLPEETFQFIPPPDATPETGGGGFGRGGGGGGFVHQDPDEKRRLEHRGSHEWEGDTLVEHSKWKIRGIKLTFERRLTFSDGGTELSVAERIAGPKGEVETTCKLPVG
ncbi:MAG: LolA family protein [Bryobacteraceae bacterium]